MTAEDHRDHWAFWVGRYLAAGFYNLRDLGGKWARETAGDDE